MSISYLNYKTSLEGKLKHTIWAVPTTSCSQEAKEHLVDSIFHFYLELCKHSYYLATSSSPSMYLSLLRMINVKFADVHCHCHCHCNVHCIRRLIEALAGSRVILSLPASCTAVRAWCSAFFTAHRSWRQLVHNNFSLNQPLGHLSLLVAMPVCVFVCTKSFTVQKLQQFWF